MREKWKRRRWIKIHPPPLITYTLDLKVGWNMVSFPVLINDTSIDSIFDGVPYYVVYNMRFH